MNKRIYLLVFIIIALALCLVSCNKIDFDDLTIDAVSEVDVPAGEYTLEYTIENVDEFAENYDLVISVKIFDDGNKTVTVENNRTFTVETDNIYYVTVYVKALIGGEYQTKSKSFTITSIKTDPILTLVLVVEDSEYDYKTITVGYGESYALSDMPEIPDSYPSEAGYTYTITNRYWYVLNSVEDEEALTQEHLNNITSSFTIYACFEYRMSPLICTITFDSNSGTAVNSITQAYNSSVVKPTDPTRDGYYFLGWYSDSALTTVHQWLATSSTMTATCTLYAKWLATNNGISDGYLNFTLCTDTATGYNYYSVSAKEGAALPTNIVIPNGYGNYPVNIINDYAFTGHSEIVSVTIPDTITAIGTDAFKDCTALNSFTFAEGIALTKLNIRLFSGCTSLVSLVVPDTVVSFATNTFSGCSSLTTVTLSATSALGSLPDEVFADTLITAITLPSTLVDTELDDSLAGVITITYYEAVEEEE